MHANEFLPQGWYDPGREKVEGGTGV